MSEIKVGSRGSALALCQTRMVVEAIQRLNPGVECRIDVIKTTGDKILDVPLAKIGDKGLFVKEIEAALLAGEIDVAVHSAKDLPSEMDDRLCIAAFPERECPADALISRHGKLMELPAGAVVGTSSLRRRAQILAARPDVEIADVRGNLDTRLRKLDNGDYDAIMLACAGLVRMGLESRITEALDYDVCLPAAGQGSLAIQCRTGDGACDIAGKLDSSATRCCVTAERALLKRLGGGCQVPIAALARIEEDTLVMDALVAGIDGASIIRKSAIGDPSQPEELGERLANELLNSPAKGLLDLARTVPGPKDRGAA
jgi:hydroxymethylbilane synthase